MNKTLLLAGVAACLFSANAHAFDATPYVSAKLRYSMLDNELKMTDDEGYSLKLNGDDNVFGGSIAVGISSAVKGGAIRAELEYNKNAKAKDTSYNIIKTEVETQSTMLNAYYDIDTGTKFTPYVGAGLGFAKVKGTLKVADVTGSESQYNFAWQVGAGIGYALNDNVSLDAGYRYVDYGHWTTEDVEETDRLESTAHELYVGARYAF